MGVTVECTDFFATFHSLSFVDEDEGARGDEDEKEVGGMDNGKAVVGAPNATTVTTAEAGRMPQFTCPYCQRLYVSLTYFRKHLAAHAPSHSTASTVSPTTAGAAATKSALTTDCSTGSTADFCEVFTEEVSLTCSFVHRTLGYNRFNVKFLMRLLQGVNQLPQLQCSSTPMVVLGCSLLRKQCDMVQYSH